MELTIYLSCQSRLTHFDPNPLKLNTNPQKKHVVFAVMSNIAPPRHSTSKYIWQPNSNIYSALTAYFSNNSPFDANHFLLVPILCHIISENCGTCIHTHIPPPPPKKKKKTKEQGWKMIYNTILKHKEATSPLNNLHNICKQSCWSFKFTIRFLAVKLFQASNLWLEIVLNIFMLQCLSWKSSMRHSLKKIQNR